MPRRGKEKTGDTEDSFTGLSEGLDPELIGAVSDECGEEVDVSGLRSKIALRTHDLIATGYCLLHTLRAANVVEAIFEAHDTASGHEEGRRSLLIFQHFLDALWIAACIERGSCAAPSALEVCGAP